MKKIVLAFAFMATLLLVVAGVLLPLGSYTTTNGCPTDPTPVKRLHLILGDSIENIKNSDVTPPANVGCSANTKYVLYLF